MIRHVVAWTMNGADAESRRAQAEEAAEQLRTLPALVPSIRSFEVGVNELYPEGNADLVLVSAFDDAEGLEAYVVHPEHQKVAAFVRDRVAGRAAVDFTV